MIEYDSLIANKHSDLLSQHKNTRNIHLSKINQNKNPFVIYQKC